MQKFRSHTAVLLLLLFVFPFIQKGIHDLQHRNDPHCNVLNAKHLHKQEHVCSICDFTFSDSKTPLENNYNIVLPVCNTLYSVDIKSIFLSDPDYKFSPRSPPFEFA